MNDILEVNPIIGAVKNQDQIEEVAKSDCDIVFLLNGDINIKAKDRISTST